MHQLPAEPPFKLLVARTDRAIDGAASIELCGHHWELAEYERIADAPPFTCVSYSWGAYQADNPFNAAKKMSRRMLPVLETAIAASRSSACWSAALAGLWRKEQRRAEQLALAVQASQAIWIDFFCLPSDPSALEISLRSMGAVYRCAAQVIAVLLPSCAGAVKKIRNGEPIEHDSLLAIESDDWSARAWIYQEIVVSQIIYFAAEGAPEVLLNHQELLNALVTGTTAHADANQTGRNLLVEQFPRLDSLQDVFVELQNIEYSGRPVIQVLGAMRHRLARDETDHIYAMLAVVADAPAEPAGSDTVPAEYFMRACEAKNDFSYLFVSGPRSDAPGRTWRPASARFHPVVSGLAAFGNGLSGSLKETHLELHNMCIMDGNGKDPVVNALEAFMGRSFAADIVEQLRRRGYTGAGDCLKLEHGYFFPQAPLPPVKERKGLIVAVSHDVQFAQGAPGLLLRPMEDGMNRFCDIGVFIGRHPKRDPEEHPEHSVTLNVC